MYVVDKELIDHPLDINTIKNPIQNSLAYLWSRSINFSNEKTNTGKIVSRIFDKLVHIQNPDPTSEQGYINEPTHTYSLNNEYVYQNTIIQDNRWITEGTLKIVNKNINSFDYKITIGELINMFSIYENAPDFQVDYANSSLAIKNTLQNNSIETKETKVGNIIGISVGILVGSAAIAIISYIIIKRKKQKKADYLLK